MSFFRLVKGELNKILMRPLLYILTGVLVFAIFASFLMFDPSARTDLTSIKVYNECEDVSSVYLTFNSSTNNYGKQKTQEIVTNAKLLKNDLEQIKSDDVLTILDNQISNVSDKLVVYFDEYPSVDDQASPQEQQAYTNLKTTITSLRSTFSDALNKTPVVSIQLTRATKDEIMQLLNYAMVSVNNIESTKTKHSSHEQLRKLLKNIDLILNLVNLFKNVTKKDFSSEVLNGLTASATKVESYLTELETQIEEQKSSTETVKDDFVKLVKTYYFVGLNLKNLTENVAKYYPFLNMNDSTVNTFYGFNENEPIFLYKIKEELTKQNYLIDNNKTMLEFSNVFAQNQNSASGKNAFDLMYFGLEITSFIIIIFTVVLVAGTLAGEQSNGTLKLLLIRPYSRSKILTSKLIASLIFAFIFILFSAVIFFLIGMFVFGVDFTPILAVFNAETAFVVHPVVLMLIYFACLMLKVLIFVLISLAISAIFRNNVAAVGISIVLYIVLSILAATLAGSYWYGFLPLSNIELFKFFGGSFLSSGNYSAISMLFSAQIFHGISFWYAFAVNIALCVIIAICSYWIFAKREIK